MSDFADPEPGDENDPERRQELFETLWSIGSRPEDLPDPRDAALYAEWLKTKADH